MLSTQGSSLCTLTVHSPPVLPKNKNKKPTIKKKKIKCIYIFYRHQMGSERSRMTICHRNHGRNSSHWIIFNGQSNWTGAWGLLAPRRECANPTALFLSLLLSVSTTLLLSYPLPWLMCVCVCGLKPFSHHQHPWQLHAMLGQIWYLHTCKSNFKFYFSGNHCMHSQLVNTS